MLAQSLEEESDGIVSDQQDVISISSDSEQDVISISSDSEQFDLMRCLVSVYQLVQVITDLTKVYML